MSGNNDGIIGLKGGTRGRSKGKFKRTTSFTAYCGSDGEKKEGSKRIRAALLGGRLATKLKSEEGFSHATPVDQR